MADYLRHEALHMASFFARAVDEELAEHECIRNNPEWAKLVDTAVDALAALYQKIGAVHLSDEPNGG